MITRSQNFNGCGNKIFLDCESDAYQSVKRQNDYRITKLDYNEATGILSISQNPDITKFTNIGDNSVTSNTFRSHLDAIEYILDYNKFKKSGTSKFDKCSNYLVYNQYAEADKKYIYFTYSQNANRWYEISLNEGDEFYDKLKNIKYRYHNGRLVNVVDVKLTKSQDRVGDRGTNITLNVEPSTSKGVVIPVVDEYNAGLMHPNDFRRFKDIDSELVGSFNIIDVDNNHWKLELVNKNGEVITSILIDKDNDNYLHDAEAVITNGRRTLNFQMYDKTGPTTIYNVDLEDWFDYTGVETSSIRVEVNDNDEISANLKISSDKDNTLSLDNEGLVSILKWLDGDRINFKLGTEVDYDSKVFENVIYFATDTKNIIINGNKYGIDFNDNDIDLVSKIEFTDTIGEFKITNTNGEIYTLSLPLATSDYNGLMSAEDKKKLNTLANTSISQISKVFRDGQQGLEIVISDIVANQTKTIFIPFSEVDRENNGLMSIADKIKLDGLETIINNNLYYQSDLSDDLATLEEHGGLPAGTTVANLKQMTLSEIFDEILFPTIYPTYVNPSASLRLTSTSVTPSIQEVGTTGSKVPTVNSFTTGYNPGAINILSTKQANRGGALNAEQSFIYINDSSTNTTFPTTIPDGNITYRYRAYYAQGPQPKDSKGNNYQTPLAAGYVDSGTVTVYGVYPYFTNKANITTFAKLPLTTSTTLSAQEFVAEGPNKHAFKLPAKYKLTKVEMLNTLSGKYEDFGTDRWSVTTESIDVQGHNIEYKVYTRNDSGFNGISTFNITFSKS